MVSNQKIETNKDGAEKTPAIVRKAGEVLNSAWFRVVFGTVKIGVYVCSHYSELAMLFS